MSVLNITEVVGGKFFYYKHSIFDEPPLEEDHIDTIADFLIAN